MKQNIMKYSLITALLLWSGILFSQEFAERSIYKGSYLANEDMTFELTNKYGNVQIINWDKDSIEITTEVYLSASSLKKLNKLKNSVKIKYDATTHHLFAQTILGNNSTLLINELQSFTKTVTSGTLKMIDINYKVYVPKGIKLKIKNQYGDIYLDDRDENVEIELSNGTLKANMLKGTTDLNLRFVKATIHQINDGDVNMYYSTLDLEKAISIKCESRSSELYAENIGVLKLRSSRDEMRIREVGYLYGTISYPKLKIGKITTELDCDLSYGDIIIEDVDKSATIFNIRSEKTDIEVNLSKTLDYNYEYIYNESCNIQLPYKLTTELSVIDGETVKIATGKMGNDAQLDINIKAIKRCDIKMHYHI